MSSYYHSLPIYRSNSLIFSHISQCILIPIKTVVTAATVTTGCTEFTTPAESDLNTNLSSRLDFPHAYLVFASQSREDLIADSSQLSLAPLKKVIAIPTCLLQRDVRGGSYHYQRQL